jgi:hypothetical protein
MAGAADRGGAMKAFRIVLAAAITLSAATAAVADGSPRSSRKWRAPDYVRAGMSYNQITPYYVGYFPSHYSHYRPDPIPSGYASGPRLFQDGCWFSYNGATWWGC